MILKTLKLKNTIDRDGEEIIDFLNPTYVVNFSSSEFIIEDIVLVNEEQVMRPDLISISAYGTDEYVDIILKVNEISNPFSIDLNDYIIIPSLESAKLFYKKPKKIKEFKDEFKKAYIDSTKSSKKDKNRIEKLQKIASKRNNGSKEIRPTNQLKTNETPFRKERGKIILGK